MAARPENTAVCVARWEGGLSVERLVRGVDDEQLAEIMAGAEKVGLDVPLGWPRPFMDAIAALNSGGGWSAGHGEAVRLRRTDLNVTALTGLHPLSVATDRIAIPAMRTAGLLSRLEPELDRSGRGRIVEVYPAAALWRWGYPHRGYKKARGAAVRASLVAGFLETNRWVDLDAATADACIRDDNAFDALVAALVARAAALGLVDAIDEADLEAAAEEGWIALPAAGSLTRLL